MTWAKGKAEVEGLLDQGELERVPPDSALGDRLLEESKRHLASARQVVDNDPAGSYQLAYDAARKACAALLAVQGLRATTKGGHRAVQDAVRAQFDPDFKRFSTLRRTRQTSEYPKAGSPSITKEDADYAADSADDMLTHARRLIETGQLDQF